MAHAQLEELRRNLKNSEPFRGIDSFLGSTAGGHTQTLLGHFLPSRTGDLGSSTRVEVTTPDGDRLVGFQFHPTNSSAVGLLHIFHGLAGSSDSYYVPRAAYSALEVGFSVVLWNHRGCGPGRKLALEPYHSGRSDDMARVVRWGREQMKNRGLEVEHGVLGYSLSGNAACLLAARVVPAIDTQPLSLKDFEKIGSLPDFAIAINPPFDLKECSDRLSRGPSRVYGQSFMGALLESLDDRKNWTPENEGRKIFKNLAVRARKKLSLFTDVGTFDATYTGAAGGFRDHLDYYDRSSSGRHFMKAVIPLIILSADDDPITSGFAALSKTRVTEIENPLIVIDDQPEGGHMGYVDRATLFSPLKKGPRWLEKRIQTYLRTFLTVASAFLVVSSMTGCTLVKAWQHGIGPSESTYKDGYLAECPSEPNCISTQSPRVDHAIVPFTYSKPVDEARTALKEEMARVASAVLIKEDGPYLHFECRSKVMKLADDVEFIFNEETKTLQFRSASRFGYSDWGSNRKRMEDIRNKILGHI